ncbi:MAG TPA: hypothetical protein GXX57_01385 [Firmicutes bacterium]|nr:hypothetical protein [Bacillota bacterium]
MKRKILPRLVSSVLTLYFLLPFYASASGVVRLLFILGLNLWLFLVSDRLLAGLENWGQVVLDGITIGLGLYVVGRFVISLRVSLAVSLLLGLVIMATQWLFYRRYPPRNY